VKLNDFYALLNEAAPKTLSDEYCAKYHGYDNSGILVDCGEELVGALFTLDLTNAAIEKALAIGANVIVTHHPAIYGKIGNIRVDDGALLGGKLVKCLRNGISVVSMQLNLDTADGGVDESLMDGVCISSGTENRQNVEVMCLLEQGGYGRAYDVEETKLCDLVDNMKNVFRSQRILSYGAADKKITRAASFCGAGGDEAAVAFAKKQGADVMISSDYKHHVLALAIERGLSVITLTHYASEEYGFKKYYEKIRQAVQIPCYYHAEEVLR
jgi:dinuclear metal center YbgI/SA1388 family protein